jgi:hypothetical protein
VKYLGDVPAIAIEMAPQLLESREILGETVKVR